jgi:hypothetical protein
MATSGDQGRNKMLEKENGYIAASTTYSNLKRSTQADGGADRMDVGCKISPLKHQIEKRKIMVLLYLWWSKFNLSPLG